MADTGLFIDATKFSPERDISYGKAKVNSRGGKSIPIYDKNTGQGLQLSVPLMLTWGSNTRENEKGQLSYDFSLQFPSPGYENERAKAFLTAMNQLEAKVRSDAITYCRDWFNKPSLSTEQVEVLFNDMLYRPKDKDTGAIRDDAGPSLRVKIDCWDGEFSQELYDTAGKLLYGPGKGMSTSPVDLISKRSHIACIIRCGGIYFVNGKFGLTWRLVQGVVKPRATLSGQCHIKLAADEIATLEAEAESDDGEPDDTDFQEQPAPVVAQEPQAEEPASKPPKVKKRVVRKTRRPAN